jgi:hypothetical protein
LLSARLSPPHLERLSWPLILVAFSASLALAAHPADGKLEAALAAGGVAALVAAVGLFTANRLPVHRVAFEQAAGLVPATGLALLSLPAFVLALTDFPSFALAMVLFLLPVVALLFRRPQPLMTATAVQDFRHALRPLIVLAVVALALAVGLGVLATLAPRHLDGWATAAIMRAYRDAQDFAFSGDFRRDDNAWPALLAYLSWLFQVDTLVFYRTVLPPLVVMGSLLSFWALARTIFNSTALALVALAAQALILLTSITAFGFQLGWHVLFSAAEDKTAAAFVLLPVAAVYLVRALEDDRTEVDSWLPFTLLAAAIGVIHPVVALLLAMVTAVLLSIRLLVARSSLAQALPPLVIVVLAMLPSVLVFKDVSGDTEDLLSPGGEFFVGNRESLEALKVINFLGSGWAIVHPRTILTPLLIAGAVCAFLAFLRPRLAGMQYIAASLLVVGLVAFNPLAIRALSYLVTTQLTWRITWLLPAALGLTLAAALVAERLRMGRQAIFYNLLGVGALAVFGFALIGPWTNHVAANLDVTDAPERELWDPPADTEGLAHALRNAAQTGDVVLAPPNYNSVLPAFTSYPSVVVRGLARVRPSRELGERSERYEDVLAFYLDPSHESLLAMREKYGVDFVLLADGEFCQRPPIRDGLALSIYVVDDDGC